MLRIGTRVWKFISTSDRLFFGREEHLTIVHHDRREIAISAAPTLETQLEVAAETAVELYKMEVQDAARRRTEYLRSAGYDFTVPRAGPLAGIPMLTGVRWQQDLPSHEPRREASPG